ncbi:dTDP-4-dehydrorhamnose reductase [Paenibacillus sp. HJGM_3]|uniref:dTDP-4-dehydrorhamnose reductase n=1 Tax=Paenibacillus sp. HJGM_3 TaxID=3379816 RepID=UPI0038590DBA
MRIVITGAEGQLGRDLVRVLGPSHKLFALGRRELDVTNHDRVLQLLGEIEPHIIVHGAAYTKVDLAEAEAETAFLVNAFGARNVAVAARKTGAKLVYVSTDYVFDGEKTAPYNEFDRPKPISVYGASKWAGENMVQRFCDRHFIVRTSWLYGLHGDNFVTKIVARLRSGLPLTVVSDQFGSPTYTLDLAVFISRLMEQEQYGVYHASNEGGCSRYEWAAEIARLLDAEHVPITPILTEPLSAQAARPAYSVLDSMAIRLNGLPRLRGWREALEEFIRGELIRI